MVYELRQYTLHPGQRDVLIELFDREFVESQEALGMDVVGQFRDLDAPDRFVWLRGFADMATRHDALASFYGGPVWAEHKDVANATMIDSDDVHLLRPLTPGTAFPRPGDSRVAIGNADQPGTLVTATVYRLGRAPGTELRALLLDRIEPLLAAAGAPPVALLETEPAPNTYTALPVRSGEYVVVRVARFDGPAAHATHLQHLEGALGWDAARHELRAHLLTEPQQLWLHPTARSLIR